MEISLPISSRISVKIASGPTPGIGYPTAALQKGLILVHDGQDLSEEGLGFGVPLVKRGIQILYPGCIELTSHKDDPAQQVNAKFTLNLEEKVAWPGLRRDRSNLFYPLKYFLSAIIRNCPPVRGLMTTVSNALRWMFGWETVFENAEFSTIVNMVYRLDSQAGIIHIEVDTKNLSENGISEVFVMNEQGAHYFDLFRDSSGTFQQGKAIGCWDKVFAEQASFISDSRQLAFTLQQVKGASLYRGRELIGSRLAWSGFGYSFSPTIERISYQVKIDRF